MEVLIGSKMHKRCATEWLEINRVWIIHTLNNEPFNNQELTAAFSHEIPPHLSIYSNQLGNCLTSLFPKARKQKALTHSLPIVSVKCSQTEIFLLEWRFHNYAQYPTRKLNRLLVFCISELLSLTSLQDRFHDSSCLLSLWIILVTGLPFLLTMCTVHSAKRSAFRSIISWFLTLSQGRSKLGSQTFI